MGAEDDDSWRRLLLPGYLTAWLLPIVGFIIGVVLIAKRGGRRGTGHGIAIVLISVVCALAFASYFSAGDDTSTNSMDPALQNQICINNPGVC
jgi:hypothetical protein